EIFASALRIKELDDISLVRLGAKSRIALKCDMLVASTDVPPGMSPAQVARKSVVSCVSDFASKGVKPVAAMISLGLPRDAEPNYIRGLAKGFAIASREFDVQIVGGDTNSTFGETVIDCSMVGIAKTIPARRGARPGDVVAVSGYFGLPPAGLRILMDGAV